MVLDMFMSCWGIQGLRSLNRTGCVFLVLHVSVSGGGFVFLFFVRRRWFWFWLLLRLGFCTTCSAYARWLYFCIIVTGYAMIRKSTPFWSSCFHRLKTVETWTPKHVPRSICTYNVLYTRTQAHVSHKTSGKWRPVPSQNLHQNWKGPVIAYFSLLFQFDRVCPIGQKVIGRRNQYINTPEKSWLRVGVWCGLVSSHLMWLCFHFAGFCLARFISSCFSWNLLLCNSEF